VIEIELLVCRGSFFDNLSIFLDISLSFLDITLPFLDIFPRFLDISLTFLDIEALHTKKTPSHKSEEAIVVS